MSGNSPQPYFPAQHGLHTLRGIPRSEMHTQQHAGPPPPQPQAWVAYWDNSLVVGFGNTTKTPQRRYDVLRLGANAYRDFIFSVASRNASHIRCARLACPKGHVYLPSILLRPLRSRIGFVVGGCRVSVYCGSVVAVLFVLKCVALVCMCARVHARVCVCVWGGGGGA